MESNSLSVWQDTGSAGNCVTKTGASSRLKQGFKEPAILLNNVC